MYLLTIEPVHKNFMKADLIVLISFCGKIKVLARKTGIEKLTDLISGTLPAWLKKESTNTHFGDNSIKQGKALIHINFGGSKGESQIGDSVKIVYQTYN